jgi:hypothetical protein
MLNTSTKIGLTIGQVIAVIAIIISSLIAYGNFAVRISSIESRNIEIQKEIIQLKAEIDFNRNERMGQINDLRDENRAEHATISYKIDEIMKYLMKNK